jgi:hypothetical protein
MMILIVKERFINQYTRIIGFTLAEDIQELNITKIKIRSIFNCKLEFGVCSLCYGTYLTKGYIVL